MYTQLRHDDITKKNDFSLLRHFVVAQQTEIIFFLVDELRLWYRCVLWAIILRETAREFKICGYVLVRGVKVYITRKKCA